MDASFVDDVVQDVRHKLFVGPPPKVSSYTGRGPFETWLRVVACRAAFDHARKELRSPELGLELSERTFALESGLDTKLDRARYLEAFRRALHGALAELEPRERNILRLHYAGGVNIDGIGLAYRVHRATVARWIARLRSQILDSVRAELRQSFEGLSESEFRGLTHLVQSQLDFSVSSWMSSSDPALHREAPEDECPRSA
jgi:RNA polymerase sigma-70 factor (ECF subfamily)